MEWYYTQKGQQCGPVDEADLRQLAADGTLKPTDYVWNQTMGNQWLPAASVPGLFGERAAPASAAAFGPGGAIPAEHLQGPLSCRAPVRAAWARMKIILFRPFALGKWFVLGFSAWLATLGEKGGTSFSGQIGDWRRNRIGTGARGFDLRHVIDPIRDFWAQYGQIALAFGLVLLLVGLVLILLLTWLRARGKFVFLDNVLNNRAQISAPWHAFAQHGNSLFGWYVLYQLACLLVFALLVGLVLATVILPWTRGGTLTRSMIPPLAMIGTLWLVLSVFLAYVARFVEDFLIPISYRFDLTITEAWRQFGPLYRAQPGAFILYGVFYLWLRLLAGLCVLLFIALTCCLGGCLMLIPYIGAVVLLPVSVFFRAYSVEYLAQFGDEYRMFGEG